MDKKYKLSDKCENGFYRIIALRDIPRHNVKAGDKGGLVEGEHNLSQKGDCWIGDDACVFYGALYGSAMGYTRLPTRVCGDMVISGTTCLSGGIWKTAPKVIKGSRHDVIYNDEQIAIGCECHPLEWWEKNGLEVAESDEFTLEQIDEYRGYLNTIKKEYADDKEV